MKEFYFRHLVLVYSIFYIRYLPSLPWICTIYEGIFLKVHPFLTSIVVDCSNQRHVNTHLVQAIACTLNRTMLLRNTSMYRQDLQEIAIMEYEMNDCSHAKKLCALHLFSDLAIFSFMIYKLTVLCANPNYLTQSLFLRSSYPRIITANFLWI